MWSPGERQRVTADSFPIRRRRMRRGCGAIRDVVVAGRARRRVTAGSAHRAVEGAEGAVRTVDASSTPWRLLGKRWQSPVPVDRAAVDDLSTQ